MMTAIENRHATAQATAAVQAISMADALPMAEATTAVQAVSIQDAIAYPLPMPDSLLLAKTIPAVEALGFSPAKQHRKRCGFSRGTAGRLSIALLFCVPFCGLSFGQLSQVKPPPPASAAAGPAHSAPPAGSLAMIQVARGDVIEITVFDTPELSQKTRVDNNGRVDLVVGGNLWVAGLTPTEAALAIEARLRDAKVLRNPHVSVNILESTSQTVTVLGEVKNPGSYPIWGRQRVAEAVAAAGGLTQNAAHSATLTHKDSTTPSTVELDGAAQNQSAAEILLLPGDRLVVARAGLVYVLGDVGKPGGFVLDDRTPITVLQGLALAQGMNRTANMRGSLIHQTEHGPQQEAIDFKKLLANQTTDPILHDGDIVYVPLNAAKDWANRGLNSILQMAVGVVIYGRY